MNPSAELKLYFGYVSSDGLGEGRFDPEASDKYSQLAVAQARERISRCLDPDSEFSRHTIGYSDRAVASSEPEAQLLIEYAKAHWPDAYGLIIPVDRIHGSLRFLRVIRFIGATRDQSDNIVGIMSESGHLPYTREMFRRDFGGTEEEFIERNLKKWKAALSFHLGGGIG